MNRTLRFNRSPFADSYKRNPKETHEDFLEGIKLNEYRFGRKTSLADVFEGYFDVPIDEIARSSRGFSAMESADVQTASDFKMAVSQFMLHEALNAWQVPGMIADNLCTPRPATTASGLPPEKCMYWPLPSDNDATVYGKKDGDKYNAVKMPTAYVEMLGPDVWGATCSIDRKTVLLDKTGGQLVDYLNQQVVGLRVFREKRMLNKLLGVTGSWRFGAYDQAPVSTYSHYLTSGLYTNSVSNTLTDWNSLKQVWLKLLAVTDPVTGQAMMPPTNIDIVVPPALLPLVQQIIKSVSVGVVDNSATTGTVRFYGPNPVNDLPMQFTVHSNQFVYLTTSSNTTWFAGDFKAAYKNCQLWPFEEFSRGQESPRFFEADVLYEKRFDFAEEVNAYIPFRCLKST